MPTFQYLAVYYLQNTNSILCPYWNTPSRTTYSNIEITILTFHIIGMDVVLIENISHSHSREPPTRMHPQKQASVGSQRIYTLLEEFPNSEFVNWSQSKHVWNLLGGKEAQFARSNITNEKQPWMRAKTQQMEIYFYHVCSKHWSSTLLGTMVIKTLDILTRFPNSLKFPTSWFCAQIPWRWSQLMHPLVCTVLQVKCVDLTVSFWSPEVYQLLLSFTSNEYHTKLSGNSLQNFHLDIV